ncbi:hypothetical protein U0C82_03710 [Fulvimarina sp. 2208YS6-2-32]|uniref:Uncharacterized protein n=1 Tax=Fulvimarina uroteuthidis TaxID=3098149 RepID=A0ABU5HYR3_9HYPH|nr:hypothetical protein [Fulvimarina sp. 2208YS6-2-32]MDY8108255.1 hypothetical protein [Fulvimarina sp. 2208YS6-2-32]
MTIKVTNTSNRIQSFTTNTGARVHLDPGETKSIALDRDDTRLKAKENARLVSVGQDAKPAKKAAAVDPAEKAFGQADPE